MEMGEPTKVSSFEDRCKVYPHGREGTPIFVQSITCPAGLSPLVWGSLGTVIARRGTNWSISAVAEEP
jgi:hypothetical protein